MQPAVFLDRDNTLIENDGDLGDPNEVKLIQGAAAAVGSLRGLGYKLIVVTNQGGVARGKYAEEDVNAVHERINEEIRRFASGAFIDRFYYCPYHPLGTVARYTREHPWRKPQPGMLLQAIKDLDIDVEQSWMIGDQMRDVQAGAAAGLRTVLLSKNGSYSVSADDHANEGERSGPTFTARTLVEAVRIVAQQRKPEMAEDMRAGEGGPRDWKAAAAANQRPAPQAAANDSQKEPSTVATTSTTPGTPAKQTRPFRPMELPSKAATPPHGQGPTVDNSALTSTERTGHQSRPAAIELDEEPVDLEPRIIVKTPIAPRAIESPRQTTPNKVGVAADEALTVAADLDEPGRSESDEHRETQTDPPGVIRTHQDERVSPPPPAVQAPAQPSTSMQPTAGELDDDLERDIAPPAHEAPVDETTAKVVVEPATSSAEPESTEQIDQPVPDGGPAAKAVEEKTDEEIRPRRRAVGRLRRRSPTPAAKEATETDPTEDLLRQMLQEMRNQQALGKELSSLSYVAIVLQLVAGLCLLAGIMISGDDGSTGFIKWLGAGVLTQLAVIAMLLFDRN